MKTTIFSFLLLAGLIFAGCSNKHPKIGFLVHSFESPRWQNDQKYFVEAVKQMKPFLIGGFLSIAEFSKLGYDMNLGVDGYLIGKAKEDSKVILELESQAGQLKMLNEMSPKLQEAFLENAISTLESGKAPERVTGMVNAWQSGDVSLMQEVAKAANKDTRLADQLDEVLLFSRHDAMLKKIESYLAGSVPHFVAVGSLHLVGPRGLVEMLKARGFEVRQL